MLHQLVSTQQFTKQSEIEEILNLAEKLVPYATGEKYINLLADKIIALLFYEPSTRTKLSFQSAALRLGAKVITETDIHSSSLAKGESLADTIRMVEGYSDLIIMRHPEKGSAQQAIEVTNKPFINAGDGHGQHPTQALLDLYTIKQEQRKINNCKIALVGDLKYGRTVHSLVHLLKFYKVELVFVSPTELQMPKEICEILTKEGVKYSTAEDFQSVINEVDVVYMTRVQKERFDNQSQYEALKDSYILTSDMLKRTKDNLVILHPLPRISEIAASVDSLPKAAYFRQVANGVPIRMALLSFMFDIADNF
jgi:aspartate carbamoyltransferase catalytic subunit